MRVGAGAGAGAAGLATAGILLVVLVAQSRCVSFGLKHTHRRLKACSRELWKCENAFSLQDLRAGLSLHAFSTHADALCSKSAGQEPLRHVRQTIQAGNIQEATHGEPTHGQKYITEQLCMNTLVGFLQWIQAVHCVHMHPGMWRSNYIYVFACIFFRYVKYFWKVRNAGWGMTVRSA